MDVMRAEYTPAGGFPFSLWKCSAIPNTSHSGKSRSRAPSAIVPPRARNHIPPRTRRPPRTRHHRTRLARERGTHEAGHGRHRRDRAAAPGQQDPVTRTQTSRQPQHARRQRGPHARSGRRGLRQAARTEGLVHGRIMIDRHSAIPGKKEPVARLAQHHPQARRQGMPDRTGRPL